MTFFIVIISLLIIGASVALTYIGVKQCNANNSTGLIWLFLGLGIFGLVIGYVLLSKAKNKEEIKENIEPDTNEWSYDNEEDIWKRKEN